MGDNLLAGERDCSTTGSFTDHDIEDGSTLIQQAYYRLADGDRTEFEPTTCFDSLESAFVWASLGAVRESGVTECVEAAIDDARAHTAEEFDDRPDADRRTDVVPSVLPSPRGVSLRLPWLIERPRATGLAAGRVQSPDVAPKTQREVVPGTADSPARIVVDQNTGGE